MAPPKKKVSKSRRNMRRSHHNALNIPKSRSICTRCSEPKLPHRVCLHCGFYKDREVIKMDNA